MKMLTLPPTTEPEVQKAEITEIIPPVKQTPKGFSTYNDGNKAVELFSDQRSPLFWANLMCPSFIAINQGGTSSGKTESIIRVLIAIAIAAPKYIITVVTNTIKKLKEDSLKVALEVIAQPDIAQFVVQYHATDMKIIFSNGSTISFKSFETLEQAKGEKRHILYVNEATRITWAIFYEMYIRTMVRIFIDYNPTAEFWVHKRILADPIEFDSVAVFRSWHIHNPYLPEAMRKRIESIADKEMWKVYARGLTGILRGTIYVGWVEVEDFPYQDGVIWAGDWGFSEKKTADPTAFVRIMIAPPDRPDLDYIVDEVAHGTGLAPMLVAQCMREAGYKQGQPVYCDHNQASVYELQLHGITGAMFALKGPGSVLTGILFLKRKRIGYTKRSANIREELKHYKFLEIEGIVTNTPVDEHNHDMDAVRYGIYSHAIYNGQVA